MCVCVWGGGGGVGVGGGGGGSEESLLTYIQTKASKYIRKIR